VSTAAPPPDTRPLPVCKTALTRSVWSIYKSNGFDGDAAKLGEEEQAKNAIQACVDAGIKHIVYSTLDGGLGAKHWDSKQEGTLSLLSERLGAGTDGVP
jgi:hypothetical protein